MAKATIQSVTGAMITVEGTEEEVANILLTIERGASIARAKHTVAERKRESNDERKRQSASDLVIGLKEEGFLEKPRSLSEIAQALEEKGYLYPVTTLSGVVLGLVQKKYLRRKKTDGKWLYGK